MSNAVVAGPASAFDLWADNWMAVYIDGELIGEDPVPMTSGVVVAGTDLSLVGLVVHSAPLNTECVGDADPDGTCEFLIVDTPANRTSATLDNSSCPPATQTYSR
ncbi:MAG: hypothetical protein ACJAR2_000976 [Ilumatobacter sp.]|jgi:hypothetical protein